MGPRVCPDCGYEQSIGDRLKREATFPEETHPNCPVCGTALEEK
jgi:hypothetical protein